MTRGALAQEHTTAIVSRVNRRLAYAGLTFDLQRAEGGYRWQINDDPGSQSRGPFRTVREAVEHADRFTNVWYPDSHLASETLP